MPNVWAIASEEWRAICGYSGRYEISSLGRVRDSSGRLIKSHPDGRGYLSTRLRSTGSRANEKIHRLVCRAFHADTFFEGAEVAHLDGDSANNRADNLLWATRAENEGHKVVHGTSNRGTRSPHSKLTEEQVSLARQWAAAGIAQRVIAERFGVKKQTINDLIRQKTYTDVSAFRGPSTIARGDEE